MGQSIDCLVNKIFADFSGVDDIITNWSKEREPGIKIIEHTP